MAHVESDMRLVDTYLLLIEAYQFSRASLAAKHIQKRRLALALHQLSACETAYFTLSGLDGRHARSNLERRIDATAADLECCLAIAIAPPSGSVSSATTSSSRWTW